MSKIVPQNDSAIELAIQTLKEGGLVVFPCETVYGVAVDSHNGSAVLKLNEYKKRPLGKPYAIMCSDQEMAEKYVYLNQTAKNIYKKFLPGPVTVVSKSKRKTANNIASENGTIGVRIPDYQFMIDLIKKYGRPIVATSANASYQRRPYKLSDILDNISEKQKSLIDLMIDAGELPHNEPSTVIDTTLDDDMVVLRQGDIKLKDKNEVLSRSEENTMNIAKELWQRYEDYVTTRPLVFALEGQMGAGKTHFIKGLAKAMGIETEVTSPSYDLLNDYGTNKNKTKLIHIDTWRMIDPSIELATLDFKELLKSNSVISIEWADRVTDEIKNHEEDSIIIWVKLEYGKNDNDRLISWGNL